MIDFAVVEGKIRFGLNAVKNVGESACRAIVRAREEGGPFTSIWDFTERVDPSVVNKRALESLVKCGALDSTGASRHGDARRASSRRSPAGRSSSRTSCSARARSSTSATSPAPTSARHHPTISAGEFEKNELLRAGEGDARALRLRASADADPRPAPPQDGLHDQRARAAARRRDRRSSAASSPALKQMTTKKGDPMVFARLEDVTGSVRGRRLQLDVRARARPARRRTPCSSSRAASTRRAQGRRSSSRSRSPAFEATPERKRGAAEGRRAHRAGRRDPRARRRREGLPGRGARVRRPRHVDRARSSSSSGPNYRVDPVPDFFASVRHLLGAAAIQ